MVKTEAERLAQQRICKRRKYAEIKNDPELYALEKEKQRLKYQKRKQEKKQKSITEKSPREQKQIRKQWKENSKKYRESKKQEKFAVQHIVDVQASKAVAEECDNLSGDPIQLYTKEDFERAERKIRYGELKKRMELIAIIKNLQDQLREQKMSITRMKLLLKKKNKFIINGEDDGAERFYERKENLQSDTKTKKYFRLNTTPNNLSIRNLTLLRQS